MTLVRYGGERKPGEVRKTPTREKDPKRAFSTWTNQGKGGPARRIHLTATNRETANHPRVEGVVAAEEAEAVDRRTRTRMTELTTLTTLSRTQRTRRRVERKGKVRKNLKRNDAGNAAVINTQPAIEPARGGRSFAVFVKGQLTTSKDVPGGTMPLTARDAAVGRTSSPTSVRLDWKNSEGRN